MTRRDVFSLLIFSAAAVGFAGAMSARAGGAAAPQTARSPASTPERLAQMRHHFGQVFVIHEALIRGDLAATRAPATQLGRLPTPSGMADKAGPYVDAIRLAGRQAADATTLQSAATAVASMLRQCGDCHRAVGVPVAVSTPAGHDVGGVVGHMLAHQRAADDMLQGLFVPSASLWRQGAGELVAASMFSTDKLPPDPKWTPALRKAETDVHAIAKQAEGDTDAAAKATRYAQLIVTCAECHSLHSRIWGPTQGR